MSSSSLPVPLLAICEHGQSHDYTKHEDSSLHQVGKDKFKTKYMFTVHYQTVRQNHNINTVFKKRAAFTYIGMAMKNQNYVHDKSRTILN
jgi:hypothetical protein